MRQKFKRLFNNFIVSQHDVIFLILLIKSNLMIFLKSVSKKHSYRLFILVNATQLNEMIVYSDSSTLSTTGSTSTQNPWENIKPNIGILKVSYD